MAIRDKHSFFSTTITRMIFLMIEKTYDISKSLVARHFAKKAIDDNRAKYKTSSYYLALLIK